MHYESSNPLLHIFIFGFHHKIGYQTEFCYPPLNPQNSLELPSQWKHLPSIALPDGAHEFVQNSVYFVLPSVVEPNRTVFGVACHRQEVVEKLKSQSSDVTRSSVMKSIAIIMRKPLFGCIRRRLETLTTSFFEEGSLTDYKLLEDAFHQFSQSLSQMSVGCDNDSDETSLYHIDLSLRKFILHHKHNVLILLKLLLLEKKVMYLESGSILKISTQLLTLLSILPGMLHEDSLKECGIIDLTLPSTESSLSNSAVDGPQPEVASSIDAMDRKPSVFGSSSSLNKGGTSTGTLHRLSSAWQIFSTGAQATGTYLKDRVGGSGKEESGNSVSRKGSQNNLNVAQSQKDDSPTTKDPHIPTDLPDVSSASLAEWAFPLHLFENNSLFLPYVSLYEKDVLSHPSVYSFHVGCNNATFKSSRKHVHAMIGADPTQYSMDADVRKQTELTSADLRFMDFLLSVVQATTKDDANLDSCDTVVSDENVSQYVDEGSSGANSQPTNVSIRNSASNSPTKSRSIGSMISTSQRMTKLSQGARFPSISSESELSAWEGSDDWIREHFRIYLQALLLAAAGDHPSVSDFNTSFVVGLRATRHYQRWLRENNILTLLSQSGSGKQGTAEPSESHTTSTNDLVDETKLNVERPLPWEHPFRKGWQVDDLRLRVNHLLSNTSQGKRINNMVHSTEKLVSGTSKAVYGAAVNTVLSAKSAFSGLWASVQTPQANSSRP